MVTIKKLVKDGYTVEIGPHTDLKGYYADISAPGDRDFCEECEGTVPALWEQAGHGFTVKKALYNAIDILHGYDKAPPVEKFR